MKHYIPLLLLLIYSMSLGAQKYENQYAVFDKNVVLMDGTKANSELVSVVPKGNAVRILERIGGPIYKVEYKNLMGYLVSFGLKNRFERNQQLLNPREVKSPAVFENQMITLARKTYVSKKGDYKMLLAIPKGETIKVLERVKKGKYLIQYRNHLGYCILNSYNVRDKMALAFIESMYVNKKAGKDYFPEQELPILSLQDLSLSKNVVKSGETAKLVLTLSNSGPVDAENVLVRLASSNYAIQFPSVKTFPTIEANGGIQSVEIPLSGSSGLTDGITALTIDIVQPDLGLVVTKRTLRFETRERLNPSLSITRYLIREYQVESPNNRVEPNEMINLEFTIHNKGKAIARDMKVEVVPLQRGIMPLGMVQGDITVSEEEPLNIEPDDSRQLTYRYFLNNDFQNKELRFEIKVSNEVEDQSFTANIVFPVQADGRKTDFDDRVSQMSMTPPEKNLHITTKDIAFENVDQNIPETKEQQLNTYALIIGNEDYSTRQSSLSVVSNAEFAVNDAEVFKVYCEKTLGIPARQIKLLQNATAAEIRQGLAWVNNLSRIEEGKARIIFYYSGHGLQDLESNDPVLMPVDVSVGNIRYGVHLSEAFHTLAEHPSEQVTVFLDACFSGSGRNYGLQVNKGIKVRVNEQVIPGNMVVFSSSSGDETSTVFRETKHGYFTYFLLKKLKQSKGTVNFDDLHHYITKSVQKETGLNGVIQTPEVNVSYEAAEKWREWRLKD